MSKSLAKRLPEIFCRAPTKLDAAQEKALHAFKSTMAEQLKVLYKVVPEELADPIIITYANEILKDA